MPETLAQQACKCGHALGAHNNGSTRYYRNRSHWACLSGGCDCRIFETVEEWADRLARSCPHCDGTGIRPSVPEQEGEGDRA